MENIASLQLPNRMKFPDCVRDLQMAGGELEGVIKEKLKTVLAAKLSGTESNLDDILFVGRRGESFDADPQWIEPKAIEGWDYFHLMGLSGDYGQYEEEIWRSSGHDCSASMWLTLLSFGEFSQFVKKEDLSYKDLDDLLAEYMSFWLDYDVEPSGHEAEEMMSVLYKALLDIRNGKAKENDEVVGFIDGLSECYGDMFSFDTILGNLEFFTDCLSCGNADHEIKTVVISGSELFYYSQYRDRVPENVRRDFDNAVHIVENPLPYCESIREDNKEKKITAIALRFEDCGYCYDGEQLSTLDAHPLFTEALHFLIDNLPSLRMEYGDASASPVLFFLVFLAFPCI